MICFNLSYKISTCAAVGLGRLDAGLLYTFNQPRHVAREVAHGLKALGILRHLLGRAAVDHRPVGGGHDRHLADGEVLVYHVHGRGGARPARADYAGGGLVGKAGGPGVEHAVEEGEQAAGGGGIVHRGAHDEAVRRVQGLDRLVHAAAADAAPGFVTCTAGDAAAGGLAPDVEQLGLHAAAVQHPRGFVQGEAGAAVLVGAAVDEKNLHRQLSSF